MASVKVPPHARAGQDGRGHRFAAYPRCSAGVGGSDVSRLRLTASGVLIVIAVTGAVAFVCYLRRALQADSSGQPEEGFWAIVYSGLGAAGGLLSGVAAYVALSGWRSSGQPRLTANPAVDEGLGVGGALASASLISGLLSWVPLLPVLTPVVYAAAAVLLGLLGVRALAEMPSRVRDRRLAFAGSALGFVYLALYLALTITRG
jgi:hypothetical protein